MSAYAQYSLVAAYILFFYKRSPYFVGSRLWDALLVDTIELPNIYTFKNRIKRMDNRYMLIDWPS